MFFYSIHELTHFNFYIINVDIIILLLITFKLKFANQYKVHKIREYVTT